MKNTPHQLTENVKLLQKIVLWQGEKFLILQRSTESPTRPNCWDLPGGNVEWPESEVDLKDSHLVDLAREVKEETGLTIDISSRDARQSNVDRQKMKSFPSRHAGLDPASQNADGDIEIDQENRDGDLNSCYEGSYFESQPQIYTIIVGWQYHLPKSSELPKVVLSSEHQNYAWINPTDFNQYDFGFAGEEGGFIREIVTNAS